MESIKLHENDKAQVQKDDVILRNTKKRTRFSKYQLDPQYWATDYILEYAGNRLTKGFIFSQTNKKKEEIAWFVFDFYRSKGFPYPWYEDSRLIKDWMDLCYFDSSTILKENNIISSGVTRGNLIFKHFNPHFWHARGPKGKSAIDIFHDDKEFMDLIRNRLGITFVYRGISYPFDICGNQIRQGMRSMRKISHITSFKPVIAKFFYEKYCEKHKVDSVVYDYSHGFGQRFLGAMSTNGVGKYISVDPWGDTIIASNQMALWLKKFGVVYRHNLNIGGSESFCPDIGREMVDMAFSSPPFYNTEIYSDDETQAYNGRTYQQFLSDYWLPTVKNIKRLLKPRGILILDIVQKMRKDYEGIILDNGFKTIDEYKMMLNKSHLTGKVGSDYSGLVKYEPIIVYQKTG